MMYKIKRIYFLGEKALVVEFDLPIAPESLQKLLQAKVLLENHYSHQKAEIFHTYTSICIRFLDEKKTSLREEATHLKSLLQTHSNRPLEAINSTNHLIPVCYDEAFAPDLAKLCTSLHLSKNELIERHTKPKYTIYFLGFLAGFLYLGGLDESLYFPRKNTPRLSVPTGSVAIGGQQTGIYPQQSPGGWNIIGNCPLCLFDVRASPPTIYQAGDTLQFVAVSADEHNRLLLSNKNTYTSRKK